MRGICQAIHQVSPEALGPPPFPPPIKEEVGGPPRFSWTGGSITKSAVYYWLTVRPPHVQANGGEAARGDAEWGGAAAGAAGLLRGHERAGGILRWRPALQ
jgi:hypothetical protein